MTEFAQFQVIATFSEDVAYINEETERPDLSCQDFALISVPLNEEGLASEAEVMFKLLSELSAHQRSVLAKVSLCLIGQTSQEAAEKIAPWLWCSDSPLNEGKLWLQQWKVGQRVFA